MYASPQKAALYSQLDVPHYLESATKITEIAEFLQAHPGQDCLSLQHLPEKNVITPFLIVFNSLWSAVGIIISEVDWKCIAKMPYSKVKQATQEATGAAMPVFVC
jgi:hypothetical protein